MIIRKDATAIDVQNQNINIDIKMVSEYKKMTDNGKLDKTSTALIRPFLNKNILHSNKNVKSYISTDNTLCVYTSFVSLL